MTHILCVILYDLFELHLQKAEKKSWYDIQRNRWKYTTK